MLHQRRTMWWMGRSMQQQWSVYEPSRLWSIELRYHIEYNTLWKPKVWLLLFKYVFQYKKSSCLLIISSLFFGLASRSLSCNGLNDGTNGCQELDSICVVKKIGTFFGISSRIRLSWIKEWSVAMGLLKIFVTYFNAKVSLLGPTWHFDYKKLILENQI